MTSTDDVAMTWQMTSPRADVSRGTLARASAWRAWRKLEARDGAWAILAARASDAETYGGTWGRVGGPMKTKFHRKGDRRDFFPMV